MRHGIRFAVVGAVAALVLVLGTDRIAAQGVAGQDAATLEPIRHCFRWAPQATVIPASSPENLVRCPILADGAGNACVLTAQLATSELLVTRSIGHKGWQAPEVAVPAGYQATFLAANPHWTIDADGTISILVRQIVGSTYVLRVVRSLPSGGWSAPQLVYSSPVFFQEFDLEADGEGNLVVAFEPSPTVPTQSMHSLHYHAASDTWSAPVLVSPPGATASGVQVVRNATHTALWLIYYSSEAATKGMWAHRWDAQTRTWSAPQPLPDTADVYMEFLSSPFGSINAVVDEQGEATVLWERLVSGPQFTVHASQTVGGAWTAPTLLFPAVPFASRVTLAGDAIDVLPSGEILGVATRPVVSFSMHEMQAMHFRPGEGWSTVKLFNVPVPIQTPVPSARCAFMAGNRAIAVVRQSTLRTAYSNGAEWSKDLLPLPSGITVNASADAGAVRLGADGDDALLIAQKPSSVGIVASWTSGTTGIVNLGFGLAGTSGVPRLAASCDLVAGSGIAYNVTFARPSSSAFLVLGLDRANIPYFGGTLVPTEDFVFQNLMTDGSGALELAVAVPADAPSGFRTYAQCWIADPVAPQGFAATNALSGTVR